MKEISDLYFNAAPFPSLLWTLPAPMLTLSWALQGGGYTRTRNIAWIQVSPLELAPDICPGNFLRERLQALQVPDALGFMTSARIEHYAVSTVDVGAVTAQAVATIGLGNALRAGDPSRPSAYVGTINCACTVNVRLTMEAMLEALVISAEAKAAVLLESGIGSAMSGLPATGTGTNCHAIVCAEEGIAAPYAGKHTDVGSAIGAAVFAAVDKGVRLWKRQHPGHPLVLDRFQAAMK